MKNKRKPYSIPRLRVIKLETEEVMATSCKTMGNMIGMAPPHCQLMGHKSPCMSDGS